MRDKAPLAHSTSRVFPGGPSLSGVEQRRAKGAASRGVIQRREREGMVVEGMCVDWWVVEVAIVVGMGYWCFLRSVDLFVVALEDSGGIAIYPS